MTTPCRRKITRWSYKQPITLSLTACPHRARHALQSTTSDRSHAIGFYCRLTCGGSTFSIELGPSRNTSIHASETECSPGSLTLSLANRVTPAGVAVALDLCSCTRGICTGVTHGSAIARAREITMRTTDIVHSAGTLRARRLRSHHDGNADCHYC